MKAIGKKKALFGRRWTSRLVYTQYCGGRKEATNEYHSPNAMILMLKTIPRFSHKIKKITAYVYDIGWNNCLTKCVKKLVKHHFIEMLLESGLIFTLEKFSDCILLQSCGPAHGSVPVIRRQRNGRNRSHFESQKQICMDENPVDKCILDILVWLKERELEEKYHIAYSNCQDFARNLWFQLSKTE